MNVKNVTERQGTGNWEQGTRNGERGTGNGEPENGEQGTGNGEPGTGNGEQGTGNREPGTGNGEQGTGKRGTGNRERGTGKREQGTGNRKTGNRERGTGNGERGTGNRKTGNREPGTGNGEPGSGSAERGTRNVEDPPWRAERVETVVNWSARPGPPFAWAWWHRRPAGEARVPAAARTRKYVAGRPAPTGRRIVATGEAPAAAQRAECRRPAAAGATRGSVRVSIYPPRRGRRNQRKRTDLSSPAAGTDPAGPFSA
jgi:hypothetical protein